MAPKTNRLDFCGNPDHNTYSRLYLVGFICQVAAPFSAEVSAVRVILVQVLIDTA